MLLQLEKSSTKGHIELPVRTAHLFQTTEHATHIIKKKSKTSSRCFIVLDLHRCFLCLPIKVRNVKHLGPTDAKIKLCKGLEKSLCNERRP